MQSDFYDIDIAFIALIPHARGVDVVRNAGRRAVDTLGSVKDRLYGDEGLYMWSGEGEGDSDGEPEPHADLEDEKCVCECAARSY
jgi:hypothetical protein